jgi:hypothetical protein
MSYLVHIIHLLSHILVIYRTIDEHRDRPHVTKEGAKDAMWPWMMMMMMMMMMKMVKTFAK